MASAEEPPSRGWVLWVAYLSLIFGASGTLIGTSVVALLKGHVSVSVGAFVLLALFLVLGELRPVVASGSYDPDGVSVSTAFVFAIMLIWGPAPAIMLQFVAVSTRELLMRKQWWRVFFNAGQYAICLSAAASVLFMFGLRPSLQHPHLFTAGSLVTFAAAAVVYHLANLLLVGIILSIRKGSSVWAEITDEFWYYTSTTMAVIALSPVLAVVAMHSWQMIPLLLLPVFLVYKTASISLEREQQSLHDALTGLANRKLLLASTSDVLDDLQQNDGRVALILLDLDRFKDINDALGHDRGDTLLQEVTARLRGVLRATDTIARLGGDEFAVLTTDAKHPDDVVATARKILAGLEGPFAIADQMVETGASIGIALYPVHGDDPTTLLRRADVAMYVAKRSGGGHAVYAPEQEAQTMRRSSLAGELRRSIPQGELVLQYQPQVTMATGDIHSVEALVRWNHPREGMMPPDRFIPMAEEMGIIHPLTAWVLDNALAQLSKWLAAGLNISVSVNVSPRCIEDHSLEEMISRSLESSKIEPHRLTLELTEGVAMAAAAAKALVRLSEMGVRLSLDDFGTGYSSLLYLMRLPVNEIKIDRSFVSGLATDPDSGAIVRSAVGLGHNLGLRVVAEGLQDRAAEAILLEAGCDGAQGFLIGRPMDESETTSFLLEHFGLTKHEDGAGAVDGPVGHAMDRALENGADGQLERPTDGASGELAATADQGHPVDLETA